MSIDTYTSANLYPRLNADYRQSQRLPLRDDGLIISWVSSGQAATVVVAANTIYAVPLYIPTTVRIGAIYSEVTTASAGNIRMTLYADNNGYPGQRLAAETEITTAGTAGIKRQTIDIVVPYGFYWGAIVFSSTPTMRGENAVGGQCAHWLGLAAATDTAPYSGISVAFSYAALPATFPSGGSFVSATIPRIIVAIGPGGDLL
jgi:hypothetical protein